MKTAAQMVAHGLDPTDFLETEDIEKRSLWIAIVRQAEAERQRLDRNLAAYIQDGIAKLFKMKTT